VRSSCLAGCVTSLSPCRRFSKASRRGAHGAEQLGLSGSRAGSPQCGSAPSGCLLATNRTRSHHLR
jgi:hypothetical protein